MKLQTKVQLGGSTIKVQTGGPVIEMETVVCTDRKCYEITDQSTVRTGNRRHTETGPPVSTEFLSLLLQHRQEALSSKWRQE